MVGDGGRGGGGRGGGGRLVDKMRGDGGRGGGGRRGGDRYEKPVTCVPNRQDQGRHRI